MELLQSISQERYPQQEEVSVVCDDGDLFSFKEVYKAGFFFHIPKTGGTTVLSQLRAKYQNSYIQNIPDDWHVVDEKLDQFDFVSGHFPILPLLDKVPNRFLRFTFIRNPLTHLASQIAHIALPCTITDEKKADLVERVRRQGIAEFLRQGGGEQFHILFDNPQIRFILGLADEPLGRAHIDRAIEVLERLDFVGTVEAMTGSLDLLGRRLGIEGLTGSPRVNTNPHNAFDLQTVDRETLLAVSHRTWFDSVVFEYFTKRLARQLAAEPARRLLLPVRPTPLGRTVQLADLFRTVMPALTNVTLGETYKILGDEIFLHAPHEGCAIAELTGVDLAGIDHLDGEVLIKGEYSRPIMFGLTISAASGVLYALEVSAECGHAVVLKGTFAPLPGRVTVTLTTRMREADVLNSFAWSTFKAVSFASSD